MDKERRTFDGRELNPLPRDDEGERLTEKLVDFAEDLGTMNNDTSLVAQICELINGWDSGSLTFFGPCAEKEILRAEEELGTTLPPSYRCFLRHFGGGFIFDYEILGLVQESGHWLDIVHVNCLVPRYIPRQYVRFVYAPGNGDYYLDTSRRDIIGECPVVIFNPRGEDVPVADSFLDFLGKVKDRLI